MYRYEATNLSPNMSLRMGHDTGSTFLKSFPAGTKWYGDVTWTATEDKWLGSVQVNKVGDVWLQVAEIGGMDYFGWVAITHLGKKYCELVDSQPPEPEPVHPIRATVEYSDGSKWETTEFVKVG